MLFQFHKRTRSIPRLAAFAFAAAFAFCPACATPRRAPLRDADVAARVSNRAASVADLELALALADLRPLGVPRPPAPAALDAADPAFWPACAWLYEPGVRRARRRVEARRALARGAGVVPAIGVDVEHIRGGGESETEAMATLDILALFGVGPAAAARELARAEVREAVADLEAAAWDARFRVERAVLKLRFARARQRIAEELARDAGEDAPRLAILRDAGRSSPSDLAWAAAAVERVAEAAARASADLADARAALGVAAGLPPGHAALQSPALEGTPERLVHAAASDDPASLLRALPSLRALKLAYAIAEAEVRVAAADTWPGLMLGPDAWIMPDDLLLGGVLSLRLPMPAATQPRLRAALIERCAARERLEDALLAALTRNAATNHRFETFTREVLPRADARRAAAEDMWRAARARFRSDEEQVNAWALALDMRLQAAYDVLATEEEIHVLAIDCVEGSGS